MYHRFLRGGIFKERNEGGGIKKSYIFEWNIYKIRSDKTTIEFGEEGKKVDSIWSEGLTVKLKIVHARKAKGEEKKKAFFL